MIQTTLLNRTFEIIRNSPSNIDGIIEDNFISTGISILGRLSAPTYKEINLFANRGMNLTAVIYCQPYAYDQQRDLLVNDDIIYQIKEVISTRDQDGNIAFLKIFADETNADIDIGSS